MKQIPLSKGYFAIVDDEDFERCSAFKWYAQTQKYKNGTEVVYARTYLGKGRPRKKLALHRFILGVSAKNIEVDHIDHDGLNCRKENLREATSGQNKANIAKRIRNATSRFKGVSWHKGNRQWNAAIKKDKRSRHIGTFRDEVEAAKAYDATAIALFGEFAYVNYPERGKVLPSPPSEKGTK